MDEHNPNEVSDRRGRQDDGRDYEINPPIRRPYDDISDLYDIPPVRPDDPPLRHWWVDDEPQQNGSGS